MKVFVANLRLKLTLPIVLVLLLVACSPAPVLRNDDLLHDDSLITGQPCDAPCWNGITPGETSWGDALVIIEDNSDFTNLQFQDVEETGAQLAAWQSGDGPTCCQMVTQDGEIVDQIFLLTAPDVELDQLIAARGDPIYVVGTEVTDDQAVMNLFYPDASIMVYAFVEGAGAGRLSPSSEIIGALYTTSEIMNDLIQFNNLYVWEGYETYGHYDDEQFDVTAAPTPTPEESDTGEN